MEYFLRTEPGAQVSLAVDQSAEDSDRASETPNPVVLVHGMGGDHNTWRRLARRLHRARLRVITYDQRGHGLSSHSDDYSLNIFRDDLIFLLNELGIEQAALVGHSLGAHVAARAAMAHPDRVSSLVLEEIPPMPKDQSDIDEEIERKQSIVAALRGAVALTRDPRAFLGFDRTVSTQVTEQFRIADADWWSNLTLLTMPTLVISGGTKSFLPPHRLRAVADTIPDARFVEMTSGHSVHRDEPRTFTSTVTRFLTTNLSDLDRS